MGHTTDPYFGRDFLRSFLGGEEGKEREGWKES